MTEQEKIARLEELRAIRKQKQAEILGQVTLNPVGKGEKTTGLSQEQKQARLAELQAAKMGEEPMAAKAAKYGEIRVDPIQAEAKRRYEEKGEGVNQAFAPLQAFAQAGSFGLPPYLAAIGDSIASRIEGKPVPYSKNVEINKALAQRSADEHPVSTVVGSMGGAYFNPLSRLLGLIPGTGVLANTGRGVLQGTVGGVSGEMAAKPQASQEDVIKSAVIGAPIGGAFGLGGSAMQGVAGKYAKRMIGSEEGAEQALSYGFSKNAPSLFDKNKDFLNLTYAEMKDIAQKNPNVLVQLPEDIVPGDIRDLAMARLMRTSMSPQFKEPSNLENIASFAEKNKNKINPSQSLDYQRALGREAYNARTGLEANTDLAEAMASTRGQMRQNLLTALPDDAATQMEQAGANYGKGADVRRGFKPTAPGAKPELKKSTNMTGWDWAGTAMTGGPASPILWNKILQTVPGFTGTNVVGKGIANQAQVPTAGLVDILSAFGLL